MPKPKRRWWEMQLAGPPRLGYVFGSLLLLCGLAELIVTAVLGGHWWSVMMGVYFMLWSLLMFLGARARSRDAKIQETSSHQ